MASTNQLEKPTKENNDQDKQENGNLEKSEQQVVKFMSRKRGRNREGNRTSNKKARQQTGEEEEESSTPSLSVVQTNLRLKNNPMISSSVKKEENKASFSYESDRKSAPSGPADQGATAQFELETEEEKEKARKGESKQQTPVMTFLGKGVERDESNIPKTMRTGPVRVMNSNVRSMARFDYQPDLCKDYKETGFCGYGDNCIYLHDRGDYKSGWQLEREWNDAQKNKRKFGEREDFTVAGSGSEGSSEDDLPFACSICRKDFVDPILTRCGHYFCEKCALNKAKKSKRCFVCGENTQGIFNSAPKLLAKLKEKRERQQEEQEEEEVGGEGGEES